MNQTSAPSNRSLTVLVPIFNEEHGIRPFLDELYAKGLKDLKDYEVIMVEDGSKDNTAQVLHECAATYPHLIAMTNPERCGYRVSVTKGILAASKDWILLMDGDGQIEPADISLLLDTPLDYDIVVTEKFPRCDPTFRILMSRCFDIVMDLSLGISIRDINFGFKLMRSSIAKQIAPQCEKLGEIYTAELVMRFVYAGCRLRQMRVRHRKRAVGTSQGMPPNVIAAKVWRAFTGLLKLKKELTSGAAPTIKM